MNRGMNTFRGGPRHGFTIVEMPNEKHIQIKIIKKLWKYIRVYKFSLFITVFSIFIISAFNLTVPQVIKIVIDDYINKDNIDLNAIALIFISFIFVTIIISLSSYIQRSLMAILASKAAKDIRRDAFLKLQKLPISYYDQHSHGTIISILTNDIETIFNALSQAVPQILSAIIMIIGAIILMFIENWQLTITIIILFPLMFLIITFINKKAFKHFKTQQIKLGELSGIVKEDVEGLKVVKLYNQEENMIKLFDYSNIGLKKASFHANLYSGMMMPLIRLLDNILFGIVVTVGAILNIRYSIITTGQIQAITGYSKMFVRPVSNLAQIYNIIQAAIAGGYRVFNLIEEKDEYILDSKENLKDVCGDIEFRNVTFGYEENKLVLKNINFKIDAGKTVAIVGPTGSGKTTLINLLARYYDIKEGNILIDNRNIYDYSKNSLRSKVGIVLQVTYLFKGTVLENIKYGRPDASYEDVIEAAKLAQVHEIIERLPKKYNTKVKEGGINFSHGERQLISIARTILSNPSILVLDEATSSVDTRTESHIQKSIGILVKNRTSFIIAHRLQTIKNADIILVIKNGEIIERGNHKELIDKQGLYYEMYTIQFGPTI